MTINFILFQGGTFNLKTENTKIVSFSFLKLTYSWFLDSGAFVGPLSPDDRSKPK